MQYSRTASVTAHAVFSVSRAGAEFGFQNASMKLYEHS